MGVVLSSLSEGRQPPTDSQGPLGDNRRANDEREQQGNEQSSSVVEASSAESTTMDKSSAVAGGAASAELTRPEEGKDPSETSARRYPHQPPDFPSGNWSLADWPEDGMLEGVNVGVYDDSRFRRSAGEQRGAVGDGKGTGVAAGGASSVATAGATIKQASKSQEEQQEDKEAVIQRMTEEEQEADQKVLATGSWAPMLDVWRQHTKERAKLGIKVDPDNLVPLKSPGLDRLYDEAVSKREERREAAARTAAGRDN